MVGRPLPGVRTTGDVLARLDALLERSLDRKALDGERILHGCDDLVDSATAPGLRVLVGSPHSPIGSTVLQAFPHTGFDAEHLSQVIAEHPDVSTLGLSISSSTPDSQLVRAAASRGLNVVVGTSHASEILENGLPLAFGLSGLLPDVDVVLFRDRVVSVPVHALGAGALQDYGRAMAEQHLLPRAASLNGDTASPVELSTPVG
jgi:hypothetical protein